jgi:hypothetical protein
MFCAAYKREIDTWECAQARDVCAVCGNRELCGDAPPDVPVGRGGADAAERSLRRAVRQAQEKLAEARAQVRELALRERNLDRMVRRRDERIAELERDLANRHAPRQVDGAALERILALVLLGFEDGEEPVQEDARQAYNDKATHEGYAQLRPPAFGIFLSHCRLRRRDIGGQRRILRDDRWNAFMDKFSTGERKAA